MWLYEKSNIPATQHNSSETIGITETTVINNAGNGSVH